MMIEQKIEFLSKYWTALIAITIGITALFYKLAADFVLKKEKKPLYHIFSFNILDKQLLRNKDLSFSFKKHPVSSLELTNIFFWNGGNITIDKDDIPQNSKLKIWIDENIDIYDINLIYSSDKANNIQFTRDKNIVILEYDFLDFEEGGILKIYHSEGINENIKITGKVKGGGNYKSSARIQNPNPFLFNFPKGFFILLIMSYVLLFASWLFLSLSTFVIASVMYLLMIIITIRQSTNNEGIPHEIWSFFSLSEEYKK